MDERPKPAAPAFVADAIVGRERELEAAEEFLRRAATRGPRAMVLYGEPGIGKTAIWRYVVDRAERYGYRILRAAPAEAEQVLAYAALRDLLQGALAPVVDALPPPQRRAIRIATLEEEPANHAVDRATVSAALLTILRESGRSEAVLIAIDDAQWLDEPSAAALAFALRRMDGVPLAVLATCRTARLPTFVAHAIPESETERLTFAPLSAGALFQLLKIGLGQRFSRPVLTRIADWSRGNPLLALELGRSILHSGLPEPGMVPKAGSLTEAISERIRALPVEQRRTLLVVAAAVHPTHAVVRAACRRLRWRLALPIASGLIDEGEEPVRLAHPLYGAEALRSASPRERRAVNRALGLVVDNAEERARHLALGATRPNARVAQLVEESAATAIARGAPDTGVDLIDLACRLTPETEPVALLRRRRNLAEMLAVIGGTARASDILRDAIEAAEPSTERALARAALARLLAHTGRPFEGVEQCRMALDETTDRIARGRVHLSYAAASRDISEQYLQANAALALLGDDSPGLRAEALVHVAATAAALGQPARFELLDEAAQLEAVEPPQRVIEGSAATRAWLHMLDDELSLAHSEYEELSGRARERGDESSLARMSVELAQIDLRAGRWDEVPVHAGEGLQIAEWTDRDDDRALSLLQLGALAASRVDRQSTERHLSEVREYAARTANRFIAAAAVGNLGALALGEGDFRQAAELLAESARSFGSGSYADPALSRFHADHLEALVGCGDLEQATELANAMEEEARRLARRRPLALVARGRGFILAGRGTLDAALAEFERSHQELERLGMPFEAARSLLGQGVVERRMRRKRRAHEDLSKALAVFESLDARGWADRTRHELGRIGLRPRAPRDLTETELVVARLAAEGHTNREIAALAFMSPKTVEGVMARVYAKLDVRSRAGLGRAMSRGVDETANVEDGP